MAILERINNLTRILNDILNEIKLNRKEMPKGNLIY